MILAVDAFGGDYSPHAAIDGSISFLEKHTAETISIILSGDAKILNAELDKRQFKSDKLTVLDAPDIITCHEQPTVAMKQKPNSSMMQAIRLVANKEADCVVSSGNTGALLAGATLIIKRIPGIKRPALTPLVPTVCDSKVLLVDCGANVDCQPEYLAQFALMGSKYMSAFYGIKSPRVALLSNGTEDEKGNEQTYTANTLIRKLPINFVGNCEGRELLSGNIDVCVCDGFVGNVMLKTVEGSIAAFSTLMKQELMSGVWSKFGALLIKSSMRRLKKRFDYHEAGGAPLLGVNGGVIKAHGSSNAKAFCNALEQARIFVESNVVGLISQDIMIQTQE